MFNITKETWEKCGITTVKYYNKKEDIFKFWPKMNDVKREIGHSNIAEAVLRRIKKYDEKTKDITENEKKYKTLFKDKKGIFIIEKVTRDITKRRK